MCGKNKVVFDCDGTLVFDLGVYNENVRCTQVARMMDFIQIVDRFLVTGRTAVPKDVACFFLKENVICRDWDFVPGAEYYVKYFKWKVEKIESLKPYLVVEDDQQISRYLMNRGISVMWVPAFAYMGIPFWNPEGVREVY